MNQTNTIQSTIKYIKKELEQIYPSRESDNIVYLLLEHVLNYSRTQIQLNKQDVIDSPQLEKIIDFVEELKSNRPIQYVLGKTEFYELPFLVNEHTLIPRPETEELVQTIIQENPQENLNILDIGTGSGCIPISLAKHLKAATIASADISSEAIKKAKENALLNQVEIKFHCRDILKWADFEWEKFDIIVSNPPYVTEAEKMLMEKNVLDHEPHTALFVSDDDPLLFYRNIANFALSNLKKDGKLYFEINESLGKEMVTLLEQKQFRQVRLIQDINGKNRIISALK